MKYKEDPKNLTHVICGPHGSAIQVYGWRSELYGTPTRYGEQAYLSLRTMTPSCEEDGVHSPAESTFVNLKLEQVDELILALSEHRERMKSQEPQNGAS